LKLLLSVPAGGGWGVICRWWPRPSTAPLTRRLVSGYSIPPPAPPTRALSGWLGANVLWSPV